MSLTVTSETERLTSLLAARRAARNPMTMHDLSYLSLAAAILTEPEHEDRGILIEFPVERRQAA